MTNKTTSVAILLVLASVFCVTKGEATEAQSLYQTCIACHGEQGQGNSDLKAPVIAGQHAWYNARQLNNFIKGIRGTHQDDVSGQQMRAMVTSLKSDTDVTALTNYIAQLPTSKSKESVKGDLMNGSRYYQAKCGACHGGKAEGNQSFNAPKLAGQNPSYLMLQMDNFVKGVRGTHKDDKLGKQMAMMARIVSEKELNDIIYYISQQ